MQQTYVRTNDGIDLFCPPPWNERGWDEIHAIANGCGPQGWKVDLVPDSILGCRINEACDLHDVGYEVGETIEDKDSADRTMLNNAIRLIRARTTTWLAKKLLLKRRLDLAWAYYEAVHRFGGPSFWDKNKKP